MSPDTFGDINVVPTEAVVNSNYLQSRDRALDNLQRQGLITQITRNDDLGNITQVEIKDPTDFAKPGIQSLVKSVAQPLHTNPNYGNYRVANTLYWVFKDVPTISSQDKQAFLAGEAESYKSRKMFYEPTSEDAFNIDAIRGLKDDHYLALWQVGEHTDWNSAYPSFTQHDTAPTMLEVAVPYMIYNLGNGQRENGVLMVDSEVGNPDRRVPISGNWFVRNFGSMRVGEYSWKDNPRALITRFGEKWESHGLLLASDIKESNQVKDSFKVAENGKVLVQNIRYSLGHEAKGRVVTRNTDGSYTLVREDQTRLNFLPGVDVKHISEVTIGYAGEGRQKRLVPYIPLSAVRIVGQESLTSTQAVATVEDKFRTEVPAELLAPYNNYLSSIDSLCTNLMGDLTNAEGIVVSAYAQQAKEAFLLRAKDFVRYGAEHDVPKAKEYLEYLTALNRAVAQALEGTIEGNFDTDSQDGRVIVAKKSYEISNTDRMTLTLRPRRIRSANGQAGQARFGITFNDGKIKENVRLDQDSNGVSVDIGKHGGELAQVLDTIGLPHYSYITFDNQLQVSEEAFEAFIHHTARKLDIDVFN